MLRQEFNAIDRFVRRLRARRVMQHTSPGERVLDVGCGQQNWLVTTVDSWSTDSLGIDPNLRPEFQGERGTTESIDVVAGDPSRRFDVALSLAVIEHLDRKDAEAHISSIAQALRPGGRLILTTPSPRSQPVLEFLAFRLRVISADEIEDHKHYYPLAEIAAVVESAGFEVESAETFQFGLNQMVVGQLPT